MEFPDCRNDVEILILVYENSPNVAVAGLNGADLVLNAKYLSEGHGHYSNKA